MNLGELKQRWRSRVKDSVAPFSWSNDEGTLYANAAVNEAAERAKLIEDVATPAVCTIAGKANKTKYALHPSIFQVNRVQWGTKVLTAKSREQLDDLLSCNGQDWSALTGTPEYYLTPQQRYLTLAKIPTIDATIRLWVYRRPIADMVEDADIPEIEDNLHLYLIDWMEHLAYQKADTQTFNAEESAKAELRFVNNFGQRTSANVHRQQQEKRSHRIVMNPDW